MIKAVRTQVAVISALVIRHMQGERRNFVYGYAWTFIQPAATIAILRLLQHVTGLEPAGMGPTTFLTLGVFGLFMFLTTYGVASREARRGVCILPRVAPFDMLIAKGIMSFITYCVLFWVFAIPAGIYDGDWPPQDPLGVQVALIADWMLAFSFAMVFGASARYFPPITEFRKFVARPLRVISGMFFVITAIPTFLWPWFTWNPVLHVTELLRSYWFNTYTTPIGSLPYVMVWTALLAVLGLGLDRFMRRQVLQ